MPDNEQRNTNRRQRTNHKRRPIGVTVLIRFFQVVGTLLLVGVLTASLLCCYAAIYIKTAIMPDATLDMSAYTMNENSVIYYYDSDVSSWVELATLVGNENRQQVEYEAVPQDLIDAFISIEDRHFWEHKGVDWYRTGGAFINMFLGMRNTFGGSTITQQLVKNMTEYDDVTVKRKIVEIFTALNVENTYQKEEILTWYLNWIYLGNGCYGVQAASKFYFGKDVSDLTLAECACLAGITNNPSLYAPNGPLEVTRYQCKNEKCQVWSLTNDEPCANCGQESYGPATIWTNRDYNKARQKLILKNMADPTISTAGAYITQAEYDAAVKEDLVFTWDANYQAADLEEVVEADAVEVESNVNVHPWYVDAVISELIGDLQENAHVSREIATQMVYSTGLKIYVPYDPKVQACVDEVYTNRDNLNYVSKTGQVMTSAITVVDNSTGYVVAMAGDIGAKTVNRGWNNAIANRQPGSSIKPLAVYSPAIEMGLITPASISDDNPRDLNGDAWPVNAPLGWRGLTTIQDAVVRSVNTVAVNTLEMITPRLSYQFVTERYGITSLVENLVVGDQVMSDCVDLGALSMGGLTKGLSTFEMAAAYATFPRDGAFTKATTYLKVEDFDGVTLIDNTPETEFVIKESTAYYMNSMLSAVVTSGTGYYARIPEQTVAGKTGTTNNAFDFWFAGYTPYYTAVVWTGYPNNEKINLNSNPSVGLWQKVMALVHKDLPSAEFIAPDGLRDYSICIDCGKLATRECELDLRGNRTKVFKLFKTDAPVDSCSCHVMVEICTDCPILDANGKETGAYALASELCPEESRREVAMVDYHRNVVRLPEDPEAEITEETQYKSVVITDYFALLSFYETMEDPYCFVHMEVEPELPIEPIDPEEPTDPSEPWDEEPLHTEQPYNPMLTPPPVETDEVENWE